MAVYITIGGQTYAVGKNGSGSGGGLTPVSGVGASIPSSGSSSGGGGGGSQPVFLNKSRLNGSQTEYLYQVNGREQWLAVRPTGHGSTSSPETPTGSEASMSEAQIKQSRISETQRWMREANPNGVYGSRDIGRYYPSPQAGLNGVWSDEDLNPATPDTWYSGDFMGLPHTGGEIAGVWSRIKSKNPNVSQDEFNLASYFLTGAGVSEQITPYGRTKGVPLAPLFLEKYVDFRKDLVEQYKIQQSDNGVVNFIDESGRPAPAPVEPVNSADFSSYYEVGGFEARPDVAERKLGTTLGMELGTVSTTSSSGSLSSITVPPTSMSNEMGKTVMVMGVGNGLDFLKDWYFAGKDYITGKYDEGYNAIDTVFNYFASDNMKLNRQNSQHEWAVMKDYLGNNSPPVETILGTGGKVFARTSGALSFGLTSWYQGTLAIGERALGFVSDTQYQYAMENMDKARENFNTGLSLLTDVKNKEDINFSPHSVLKPIPKEDTIAGVLKNEQTGDVSYMTYGELMNYYKDEGQSSISLAQQMTAHNIQALPDVQAGKGGFLYKQSDIDRVGAYGEQMLGKVSTLENTYSNYEREWEFKRDMGLIGGGVMIVGTALVPMVGGSIGWSGKELLARAGGYASGFMTTIALQGVGTAVDVGLFGEPKNGEWRMSGALVNLGSIWGGSYVGKKTYMAIEDVYKNLGGKTDSYLTNAKRIDRIIQEDDKAIGQSMEKGHATVKSPSGALYDAGEYKVGQTAFYEEGQPTKSVSVYGVKDTIGLIKSKTDIPVNPNTGEPLMASKDAMLLGREGAGVSIADYGLEASGQAKWGESLTGMVENSQFISKSRYSGVSQKLGGGDLTKDVGSTLGITQEKTLTLDVNSDTGITGLDSITQQAGFMRGAYQKFVKTITGGSDEQGMSVIGNTGQAGMIYHEGAFMRAILKLTGQGGSEGGDITGVRIQGGSSSGSSGGGSSGGGGGGQIAVSEMVKILGKGADAGRVAVGGEAINMGSDIINTQAGITGTMSSLASVKNKADINGKVENIGIAPDFSKLSPEVRVEAIKQFNYMKKNFGMNTKASELKWQLKTVEPIPITGRLKNWMFKPVGDKAVIVGQYMPNQGKIQLHENLLKKDLKTQPYQAKGTIIHEMTHSLEKQKADVYFVDKWSRASGWSLLDKNNKISKNPKWRKVYNLGSYPYYSMGFVPNPSEDLAQSVSLYADSKSFTKRYYPERHRFIEKHLMTPEAKAYQQNMEGFFKEYDKANTKEEQKKIAKKWRAKRPEFFSGSNVEYLVAGSQMGGGGSALVSEADTTQITGGRNRRRYRSESDVSSGRESGSGSAVVLAGGSALGSITGQELEGITKNRYRQDNPQDLELNTNLGQVNDQITGLITNQKQRYLTEEQIFTDFTPDIFFPLGGGLPSGDNLLGLSRRKGRKKKYIKNPLASPEEMMGLMGGGLLDGIV